MEHKSRQNRDLKIFVEKANNFHSTIKFTAEMSEIEPDHFLENKSVQRGKIQQGTNPRSAKTS